jgi:hypothetical protein
MWHVWGEGRSAYLKEGDHLEDRGAVGRVILKLILEKWEGMDWMALAQDRDRWRTLVNAVMNFRVPSFVAEDLLASQEELCSMQLVRDTRFITIAISVKLNV